MSNAEEAQRAGSVTVQLTMAGADGVWDVVSCLVREHVSQVTRATVELASPGDLQLEGALGGAAELIVGFDGAFSRQWSLRVGSVRFVGQKRGSFRFAVELFAHPRVLAHSKSTRKFLDMTVEEIVSAILGESAVPFEWRTTRATRRRSYAVQHRETNLAFVERLLAFEGIYYSFDDAGTMVLADASAQSPEASPGVAYELIESGEALTTDGPAIRSFRRGAAAVPGTATVNDYDWKKPHTPLLRAESAQRGAGHEVYEHSAGYREIDEGATLARLRLEALQVPAAYARGEGTVVRFAPTRLFTFAHPPNSALGGQFLLVGVDHEFRDARRDGDPSASWVYSNRFEAIPATAPYRPAPKPRPTIDGHQTVTVRGPRGAEIHTDTMGRFKAQFRWDRAATSTDADSRWMRMVQECASSLFLPRVGWELTVVHIDGDPDRPIGVARNIHGRMPPAYGLPEHECVMTIKTPSSPETGGYNELCLDDSSGSMRFDIRAERDLIHQVGNDRTELVGNDETHEVGGALSESVERDQSVSIGVNAAYSCEGSLVQTVGRDRTKSVGADENVKVTKSSTVNVGSDDAETVGSVRFTVSGAATGAANHSAGIYRSGDARIARTIGGGYAVTAGGRIATTAEDDFVESVGGSKLTIARDGNISQSVLGPLAIEVAGDVFRRSGFDMSASSQSSAVDVGGGGSLTSAERLEIMTDGSIEIVAQSALSLGSGALGIRLTPGAVKLTGDVKVKANDRVVVTGKPDNVS